MVHSNLPVFTNPNEQSKDPILTHRRSELLIPHQELQLPTLGSKLSSATATAHPYHDYTMRQAVDRKTVRRSTSPLLRRILHPSGSHACADPSQQRHHRCNDAARPLSPTITSSGTEPSNRINAPRSTRGYPPKVQRCELWTHVTGSTASRHRQKLRMRRLAQYIQHNHPEGAE